MSHNPESWLVTCSLSNSHPGKSQDTPSQPCILSGRAGQVSAGIYHSHCGHRGFDTGCFVCVRRRERARGRDSERKRERECMWQPWLSWLGRRERGWNRFIPRLVALHAFTHTFTYLLQCCIALFSVRETVISLWETLSAVSDDIRHNHYQQYV